MKWSLNLYKDEKYPAKKVIQAVSSKNPIIFVVPEEYEKDNIFDFINETRELKKSLCVLDELDVGASVAYLISFDKIHSRKIMFVVPHFYKNEALDMIKSINTTMGQIFESKNNAKKDEKIIKINLKNKA